ncbi:MAG: hypothetical protein IPN59_12685, partial [Holophaga sp.]|nr:hypothetical protein [Holophaga sp.]
MELRFTLAYNPSNQFRHNLALKFQSDLASIGVELQLQPYPSLGSILEQFKFGDLDAVIVAWMGYPVYDTEFVRELATANIPTAYNSYNGSNYARFSSPANDLLIQSILQPQGFAALKQAYLAQQAEFTAQLPQLPTQHFARLDGARPDLVNFKPFGMAPLTWNIAEWILPENPYDLAVFAGLTPGS